MNPKPDNNGKSYIPVVCLCGTYLRASPDAVGTTKTCPHCHGAIEIRQPDARDHRFPSIFLKATKVSGSGKARWKLSNGFEGFVEEVALRSLEDRGWKGLWGENSLWEFLMALLFWDAYFAPVPGAWLPPHLANIPGWEQDMPYDWGGPEFCYRRKDMIVERLAYLSTADLRHEIATAYSANHGRRCRPIWNWDKFSVDQLASVAMAVPRVELLEIMTRLLTGWGQTRSGIPDLFLWKEDRCAFVEVKGLRDRLSEQQVEWLTFLDGLHLRAFVLRVEKEMDDRKRQPPSP